MNIPSGFKFSDTPLAVIGMACRLPGADGLEELWSLVIEGRSTVAELPPSRLDQRLYYDPEGRLGKTYSKIGPLVSDRPLPAESYRLSRDDIENAECSHLELCHVTAEAFRHAKLDPHHPKSTRAGVYVGNSRGTTLTGDLSLNAMAGQAMGSLRETPCFAAMTEEQQQAWIEEIVDETRRRLPGRRPGGGPFLDSSEAARLVSKSFGLDGPLMTLNAACSSTLMALAYGAYALQMDDIDLAVVGGVSHCKLDALVLFSKAQSVSATGTRPFDADADGLVISEGYVTVLMKTLDRALADGDPIQAVIRGIGISSDGKGKSLSAPRREGQIAAVRRAYSPAVTLDSIQYIEAHATSTPLGDSTEINSLAEVFGESLPTGRKIPLGSLKANIGHTLESAGLASFMKTVLAMKNGRIPPIINLHKPNPKVDWENAPFSLLTKAIPWPDPPSSGCRRAGVNAFGIGGLNVHVVVEEHCPSATTSIRSPGKTAVAISQQDRSMAIVGAAVIAPGARTIDAFWNLMMEGRDPKVAIPAERWDVALERNDGAKSWVGGFIQDFQYDWKKHRVPPKQIATADPLQFMVLDAVDQALRAADYEQKLDRERTSVVVANIIGGEFSAQLQVGLRLPELRETVEKFLRGKKIPPEKIAETSQAFAEAILQRMPAILDETGSFSSSSLASRVTKTYDLLGGTCTIDSGDNSSIMALDTARNLLICGGCDLVICAAGQRALGPDAYEKLYLSGRLSSTGGVRPLDRNSDGLAPGDGVAVVLLKRLRDAERDRDKILTVIREIGVARADDARSAQARAISRALTRANVKATQVSAVEMSASGVADEDAVEIAAIEAEYAGSRQRPLHLRSVAGQIGHSGGAAGMMSLVKSALSLQNMESPACLPPRQPVDRLAENSWCESLEENRALPLVDSSGRVFSTLNSYSKGLALHVVLERAQAIERLESKPVPIAENKRSSDADSDFRSWLYEGSTLSELVDAAQKIADGELAKIQSQTSRNGARHGLAIVYRAEQELQQKAKLFVSRHSHPQRGVLFEAQGIYCIERRRWPLVAFLFPGQGSQYPGMLTDLVQEHPVASAAAARIDEMLRSLNFPTFRNLVVEEAGQLGVDVWRTQLSLLVAESILFEVVSEMGVRSDRITAHSYGEFAALIAAGAWNFQDAAVATFHRCRLITASTQINGAMIACAVSPADAKQLCSEYEGEAFVANFNTDAQTVIAGTPQAVRNLNLRLSQLGIQASILNVPRPFHTPLMAPIQQSYRECIHDSRVMPPSLPLLSSVDNRYVAEPDVIRENLVRQLVEPVRYPEQIRRLASEGVRVLVEIGPGQVLTRMNQRIAGDDMLLIGTDNKKRSYRETLARLKAALHAAGAFASRRGQVESEGLLKQARLFTKAWAQKPQAEAAPPRKTDSVELPSSEAAACVRTSDGPRETDSSQSKPGPRILTLSGEPHAMGAAHGQALAEEIRQTLDGYAKLADARLGKGLPDLTRAKSMTNRLFDQSASEEARGIAEAAGVSFESLLEHNLYAYSDIGAGCTQVLAHDPSHGDRWLHAANEDMPLGLFLRDALRRCVQVRKPTTGSAHVLFSAVGHCMGINGVNSAGVAVTSSMLLDAPRRTETLDGFLHSILVRQILEKATSVDTAVEILQRLPSTGGWGLCISAATERDAAYVEYDGRTRRVKQVSSHQLVTNHAQLLSRIVDPPSHSLRRQERLEALRKQHETANSLTVPTIQSWLRDRYDVGRDREVRYPTMNTIRRVDNQVSIVFDAHRARAWVTAGPNANVDEDRFFELDLQQLIGLEIPTGTLRSRHRTEKPAAVSRQASDLVGGRVIRWEEFARLAKSVDGHSPVDDRQKICHRFALRCLEQPPVPTADIARTLRGGVLMLGDNAQADALSRRLQSAGVSCSRIRKRDDAKTTMAELDNIWQTASPTNLLLMTSFDPGALTNADHEAWRKRRQSGLFVPYQICQRWLTLLKENQLLDQGRIVGGTRLGGLFGFDDNVDSPEGGFATGLIKGLLMEQGFAAKSSFSSCVVDFDDSADPDIVTQRLIDEAAWAGGRAAEIAYRQGRRYVVSPVSQPVRKLPLAAADYGDVWVVTGGARGVTAKIALAIGQRLGVKLHLIGSSPLPRIEDSWRNLNPEQVGHLRAEVIRAALERGEVPIEAWTQIEKALEIDKNLREFADAGLDVTYHACDVSDHAALASLLDEIRQQDGPIDGVVHGAGFEKAALFPNKKMEFAERTVGSKVDGAISLMELTKNDHLKYFVAFASISGRFGGVGQTDYCLANEMLCKLIGRLRKTRPEIRAAAIHWPSWDEVGMAVRPESKHAKVFSGSSFMPVAEGVDHFIEEVRRGCPEAEVLITDWRRYKKFYSDEYVASLNAGSVEKTANVEKPAETLAPDPQDNKPDTAEYPLVDKVERLDDGSILTSCAVHPVKDEFLAQHILRNRPILPLVAAAEAFAEAASLLDNGRPVTTIENLRVMESLRLFTDAPHEIRVRARREGNKIHCTLHSDFRNRKGFVLRKDRLHAECTVPLESSASPAASIRLPDLDFSSIFYIEDKSILYHGPIYRQLEEFCYRSDVSWAKMKIASPSEFTGGRIGSLVLLPSVLIDTCIFSAGVHKWTIDRTAVALPMSIDRLLLYATPASGERAFAKISPVEDDDHYAIFDIDTFDERGRPLLRIEGYHTGVRVASIPLDRARPSELT